jgi:uncharacterized protein DUF4259
MGTWGSEAFENDHAMDWAYDLEQTSDLSLIKDALERVTRRADEYPDASDCDLAVAAAEIVAALNNNPSQNLPEKVADWISQNPLKVDGKLIALAHRAVARVKTDSELKELWDETGDADEWYQSIDDLEARLK